MQGRDSIWEFRKQLRVKYIHLILGNHCDLIRKNIIINSGEVYVNSQNLFTSVQEYLEHTIDKTTFVMFHYPLITFHKGSRGGIQLYGHTHNDILPFHNARGVNVGIDTHPEFRPYSVDEIFNIIKQRGGTINGR